MTHNVISHIAESECSLVALTTDQNLVLSASVRVDKYALVVLRFDVGSQVLMCLIHVFILGRTTSLTLILVSLL